MSEKKTSKVSRVTAITKAAKKPSAKKAKESKKNNEQALKKINKALNKIVTGQMPSVNTKKPQSESSDVNAQQATAPWDDEPKAVINPQELAHMPVNDQQGVVTPDEILPVQESVFEAARRLADSPVIANMDKEQEEQERQEYTSRGAVSPASLGFNPLNYSTAEYYRNQKRNANARPLGTTLLDEILGRNS